MVNTLDKKYTDLLQKILDEGVVKKDRTGTGTKSIFGYQIRHNMKEGFPLLTTKKMHWNSIVVELIWFLRGDTNIKYLVDNGCNIWVGDAYKAYLKYMIIGVNAGLDAVKGYFKSDWFIETNEPFEKFENPSFDMFRPLTEKEFIEKIKTDDEFAKKWGELGPVYGKQWRSWGGYKETFQKGNLHKTENDWVIKWSDLNTCHDDDKMTTLIRPEDQTLFNSNDEGKVVSFKLITLDYDMTTFYPIQVAKIVNENEINYVYGLDQIRNSINMLRNDPDSRRNIVSAWNVADIDEMVLPPCHNFFQFYTRELTLEERIKIWDEIYLKNVKIEESMDNIDLDGDGIPKRAISLMWNQRSVNEKSAA